MKREGCEEGEEGEDVKRKRRLYIILSSVIVSFQ